MKKLVVLVALMVSGSSFGQERTNVVPARNVYYFELIGTAVGLSVNYEYLFEKYLSLRFGVGGHHCLCEYSSSQDLIEEDPPSTSTALFIVMANFLTPKYPHHLEVGAGLVYVVGDPRSFLEGKKNDRFVPAGSFAYRYQPVGNGFVFRFGATPVFRSQGMVTSFGISVGGTF